MFQQVHPGSLRDTMLFDYGAYHSKNRTKLAQDIVRNFSIVLVQERFDESLVLLKTVLNWGYEDILYQPKNEAGNYKISSENKRNASLYLNRLHLHMIQSPHDYTLYDLSMKNFNQQIALIEKFSEKVKEFRQINQKVSKWCYERLRHLNMLQQFRPLPKLTRYLTMVGTRKHQSTTMSFTSEFTNEIVTVNEVSCFKMQLDMLDFVQFHIQKYHGLNWNIRVVYLFHLSFLSRE